VTRLRQGASPGQAHLSPANQALVDRMADRLIEAGVVTGERNAMRLLMASNFRDGDVVVLVEAALLEAQLRIATSGALGAAP
jgi:hypothetical protein